MEDAGTDPAPEHSIAVRPYFFAALPEASETYKKICVSARDFERLTESPNGTLRQASIQLVEQSRTITLELSTDGAQLVLQHELEAGLIPFRNRLALVVDDMFQLADHLITHVRVLSSRSLGVPPASLAVLEFMASTLDILKVCQNLLGRTLGKKVSSVMLANYATILVGLIVSDHTTSEVSHRASLLSGTRPTSILEMVCTPPSIIDAIDHQSFAKKQSLLRGQDAESILSRCLFPAAAIAEYELINSYRAYIKTRDKGKMDHSGYPTGYHRLTVAQKTLDAEFQRLGTHWVRLPRVVNILLQRARTALILRVDFVLKETSAMLRETRLRADARPGTHLASTGSRAHHALPSAAVKIHQSFPDMMEAFRKYMQSSKNLNEHLQHMSAEFGERRQQGQPGRPYPIAGFEARQKLSGLQNDFDVLNEIMAEAKNASLNAPVHDILKAFCGDFDSKVAVNLDKYMTTVLEIESDTDSLMTDRERYVALYDKPQKAIDAVRNSRSALNLAYQGLDAKAREKVSPTANNKAFDIERQSIFISQMGPPLLVAYESYSSLLTQTTLLQKLVVTDPEVLKERDTYAETGTKELQSLRSLLLRARITLEYGINRTFEAQFGSIGRGPPLLQDGTALAWPEICRLYIELRDLVTQLWGVRQTIKTLAGEELVLYLHEGLPQQAALDISVVKDIRLSRARLAEPLARAKKCWEKLDMHVDIAQAYCEMHLDDEIGGEVIRVLEEEVRESTLVKLLDVLEFSFKLAQLGPLARGHGMYCRS